MDKKRLYVDLHVIQTVPPSCVNRDDTGRPKTAMYGGVNRARVSSQSWKHAMRGMFQELFTDEQLGYRTKYVVDLVAEAIKKIAPEQSDEKATKLAVTALERAGIKTNEKKKNTTDALFFISSVQAEKLAELVIEGNEDKGVYKAALKEKPSIDIALFGRMVASDADLNVDAAAQVAHSISTHAVQTEYDYFTAVDDCKPEDSAGAGHVGTMEFQSATLYRYATINVAELCRTIGIEDVAKAVEGFAEAFIYSMPTGKQNSYANRTIPDMVYVTVREDQPVNLCGAFEKPIYSTDGYSEKSVKTLVEYAKKVYEHFCGEPRYSLTSSIYASQNDELINMRELLEQLRVYIENEVK